MTIEIINYGETNSTNIPGTPWTRHFFLRIVVRFENWISIWLHSDVAHSGSTEPPPIPFHLFPIYRLAIFLYALANKNPFFFFFIFFRKKGMKKVDENGFDHDDINYDDIN